MTELDYLKDNVQNIQKLIAVSRLREFETEDLKKSLRLSRIEEYGHGELILQEGDAYPCIYFLLSGKIRIEKQGNDIETVDRPGEIFGEVKTLEELIISGSVYAEEKVICLAVNTPPGANRPSSHEIVDILLLLYRTYMEFSAIRLRLINDRLVKIKKNGKKEKPAC